jgi:hypothetical protein
VIADVAYVFGFGLHEVQGLELDELMDWHRQATRINKLINGKSS